MTAALLDTHALVWAITDPDRLGDRSRALLEDPKATLYVSAASAWELSTKVRLGRFPEAEPLVAQYASLIKDLGAVHLPIEPAHALRAGSLPWAHRDPFDRMLAAQALLEHTVLVTRDDAFRALGGLDILW
ncbi:MAG: type II toxin-antitoxin system VapC family toxin [Acidimicrobiia bacterium]|nr:type II toxin-antitoxin system VapC family toxin [Acidimicrobiia bacterium]